MNMALAEVKRLVADALDAATVGRRPEECVEIDTLETALATTSAADRGELWALNTALHPKWRDGANRIAARVDALERNEAIRLQRERDEAAARASKETATPSRPRHGGRP
jgi:hypothetical protein